MPSAITAITLGTCSLTGLNLNQLAEDIKKIAKA